MQEWAKNNLQNALKMPPDPIGRRRDLRASKLFVHSSGRLARISEGFSSLTRSDMLEDPFYHATILRSAKHFSTENKEQFSSRPWQDASSQLSMGMRTMLGTLSNFLTCEDKRRQLCGSREQLITLPVIQYHGHIY